MYWLASDADLRWSRSEFDLTSSDSPQNFQPARYLKRSFNQSTMDNYMFEANIKHFKNVVEATTYLEMFSYSVRLALLLSRLANFLIQA